MHLCAPNKSRCLSQWGGRSLCKQMVQVAAAYCQCETSCLLFSSWCRCKHGQTCFAQALPRYQKDFMCAFLLLLLFHLGSFALKLVLYARVWVCWQQGAAAGVAVAPTGAGAFPAAELQPGSVTPERCQTARSKFLPVQVLLIAHLGIYSTKK